jgi:predicted HD superfamily hydrolase involved in NAD metabolism
MQEIPKQFSQIAQKYAVERLRGRLLEHTLGCVETALALARRFGINMEKVTTACYLHDIAKRFTHEEQAALALKMGMSEDEIRSHVPAVLHGPVAALIVQKELGIDDAEVLQAIRFHSTGGAGMSNVAKALFIADFIEQSRTFPGATELRSQGHITLDGFATAVLANKIRYLIDERAVIAPRALEFWNELVGKSKS